MKTFDFENFKYLVDEFVEHIKNNQEQLQAILDKTHDANNSDFYHQCYEMNKLIAHSQKLSNLAQEILLSVQYSQIKASKLMKTVSETIQSKMNKIRKEENDNKE